jgi:hypothetical protein
MNRNYSFPVWGTQGGGLVREVGANQYIFIEKPDCPGLDVGDYMPPEWGIIPANTQASEEMSGEEYDDSDFEDLVRNHHPWRS